MTAIRPSDSRRAGSSTTIRFVVLVLAMTLAAANVGEIMKLPWQAAEKRCQQEHAAWAYREIMGQQQDVPADPLHGEVYELYRATYPCRGFEPPAGLVGLLSVAALFGLGAALYFLLPYARRLRRGLVPLARSGHPAAAAEVETLVRAAGVRVTVLVDPTEYRADGVAFGHLGRRHIELTAGALFLHERDPAAFRAIVMHEIGHIRNRDLDVTYLTVGLWQSFVVLTVLVLAGFGVGVGERQLPTAAHLGVLWVIVYLTRNGILRAREHEADAYAAEQSPEHRGALLALLRSKPARPSLWNSLAGTHPALPRRIAALQRHGRLDDLTRGDAFALGLITMIALPIAFNRRINVVLDYWQARFGLIETLEMIGPRYPWPSVLILVPFGAGLSIGLARAASSGAARDLPRRLILLTLALCAGSQLAILVTPRRTSLSLHWVAAPVAYYHVGVLMLALIVSAVLTVNALAWRRVVARSTATFWPWLFGVYGAAVLLLWTPHATPTVYWIIAAMPLVGVVRSLVVPSR